MSEPDFASTDSRLASKKQVDTVHPLGSTVSDLDRGDNKNDCVQFHEDNHDYETSSAIELLPPPPDGGLIAWLQVLAAFFANFNSWGIVNSFGVYQEYYQRNILSQESPERISWIGSLAAALVLVSSIFWGPPLDLGYMKYMAFVASCGMFVTLMLLGSLCRSYWSIMLAQGCFAGLFAGLLFILSIGSVAPYFSKKRPLAIGIGASGSSVGGTIYSVMARRLIEQVGYAWSIRIIAFVQLATTIVMFLCLKRRLPPRKRKDYFAFECFKELPFMLYCFGNITGFLALYIFFVYFQAYAESTNHNIQAYFYMTAILNAGSAAGRIGPGYLASKIGPFNVLAPAMVLSAVLAFCWIPAKNEGGIIAIAVLLGFISGALIGLPGAIVAHLTTDLDRLGIRLSFALIFGGIGVILGPPFAGMLERSYGWFWVKLYCAICFSICAAFMFACRQVLAKGKLMTVV